ncbi:MAG: 16S rRNA (cytosine(1402)-N(4))-methyltransferase RsmH [Bacteriovoracaceae bacterium]|nr:16S rRNA (cytosine(1402)-N(4))-methyltransferase RsmH [Bacteriovoracaceae bacterium]
MEEFKAHYSVLKDEIISHIKQMNKSELMVVDLTFGGGGHSFATLEALPKANVIGVDQDPEAFVNGQKLIAASPYASRIKILKMNFEQFYDWKKSQAPELKVDAVVMDLGVSSHHFDSPERGFSFLHDGPLDMRMAHDDQDKVTAKEIVNEFSEEDIADIIYQYGEDRLSRVIARNIVAARKIKPIETTKDLENIIFHAYPAKARHQSTHPATRTFQALRIFVNQELSVLEKTLPKMYDILADDSIICVISFHSLEDRIVKNVFKNIYQNNPEEVKIITKKPIIPGEKELAENRRSRSAKLRILMKTKEGQVEKKYNKGPKRK